MSLKIIHINKNIIQRNAKNGTTDPVCRIEIGSAIWYAMQVDILGPSSMVYKPADPRPCGAKLWVETEAEVYMHDPVKFSEIKQISWLSTMDVVS